MDDHMLDRLEEEIKLCFICADLELKEGKNVKESMQYKAAAVLIKAYNELVKLYYMPEYTKQYLKGSVAQEYKLYLNIQN